MPHIVIALSPGLFRRIAWPRVLRALHAALAEAGLARIGDIKSRVLACDYDLIGDDPLVEQVIATLLTTNPRPAEAERQMATRVLSCLERAVIEIGDTRAQCCVFFHHVPKDRYLRVDIEPVTAGASAAVAPAAPAEPVT
ncbi:hypothetical protein RHODGE_RHODGE_01212 [Rhodoplanes serenus]|uniref:5-carboxymethyl-2-hydroxymuconate isomerase n=1 Tax=Rhodoplanes serenus TaxID=200615 RepID=A0A3S4AZN0_9BRAD|nr:hypothetical protein [Rhodoplanes serenus]VCU08078.1 hypothetical protein RHODGE_RHODGE_01212 [Rhodoplanes serenus]